MEAEIRESVRQYQSRVDTSGRIVLPVEVRARYGIHAGDQLVITESSDGLQVKTQKQAIREARDVFAKLAPPEIVLSDSIIRERREEARYE